MRIVALILFILSLNPIPVLAQGTRDIYSEWDIRKEQLTLRYQTMSPEDIWQEYLASETTHLLAFNLHLYKEPYFSWGVKELLRRDPEPKACGAVLSMREIETKTKDLFFRRCTDRSYTFEEVRSIITFIIGTPSIYLKNFINKVLENWGLSNSDLAYLATASHSPEQRAQIVSRMNLGILDGEYACQLKYLEIPGQSEFLNSLCDIHLSPQADPVKSTVLYEIMMKKDD